MVVKYVHGLVHIITHCTPERRVINLQEKRYNVANARKDFTEIMRLLQDGETVVFVGPYNEPVIAIVSFALWQEIKPKRRRKRNPKQSADSSQSKETPMPQ